MRKDYYWNEDNGRLIIELEKLDKVALRLRPPQALICSTIRTVWCGFLYFSP